uniref:Down syndrome cell adhesion molecule n=1 Tax=Strigamia maritima TaxID=126957 RepID=T1IV66_STRMM
MQTIASLPMWLFVLLWLLPVTSSTEQEPKFTSEFPLNYDFSNITGGKLSCKADGDPQPEITWLLVDGSPVNHVSRLRQTLPDGTLLFPSFGIDDYRQDVHGVSYRCAATNTFGSIVSNEIKVRGVVNQIYDIHVYDVYTMKQNTAIMRCHIPKFVQPYVNITAWIKDSVVSITSSNLNPNSKYVLLPTGELIIEDVDGNDALTTYRCQVLHRLTGEVKLSNPGRLIVTESQGKVPPKIIFSNSNLVITKNERLFLPCVASGHPTPDYIWSKETTSGNYENIYSNDRIEVGSGLLVIEKTQNTDSGRYMCMASNEVNSVKISIQVTIIETLTALITPSKTTVDANEGVFLNCKIKGFPVDSIIWFKDGRTLPKNEVLQVNNETIKISKMSTQYAGIYQCFAMNELYSTFGSAVIKLGDTIPIIVKGFDEQILYPKNSTLLECTSRGNPTPQFFWSLDNVKLSTHGRININMRSDSSNNVISSLKISNVNIEDGGVYRCIAKTKKGFVEHSARISIHGKLGMRSNIKYQAIEDGIVQIDCPVYGYPMNKIQWEKDGRSMPIHIRHSVPKNGSLIIRDVKRFNDKGKYTCIVTNEDGDKVKGEIELLVLVAPKITPFSFPENVFEGRSFIRLSCVVYQGDLPITFHWLKNGKPIISENSIVTVRTIDDYSSILTIENIEKNHAGNYTCVASNSAASVSQSSQLRIHVPLRWIIEPQDARINSGQILSVDCQGEGFPDPTITWKKSPDSDISFDKLDLVENNANRQVFDNGTLIFKNIQQSDDGYYVCLASNSNQQTLSKFISIQVQAAPDFLQKSYEIFANKGDNVELPCEATGNWPISYIWFISNQKIDKRSTRYKVEEKQDKLSLKSTSLLHISWVDQKDSTQFVCLAKNEIGENQINVTLVVQENPDAPAIKIPINVENQIVKLNWTMGYNGNSEVTRYIIQYKKDVDRWDGKTVISHTTSGSETSITIPGLKPATTYNFRVMAENIIGNSSFSGIENAKTDETVPNGVPENIDVESIDANTLRVTWKPPKKHLWNGAIRGYNVGYKIHNSTDQFTLTNLEVPDDYTEELIYQLTDLHMYTQYDVIVQAYNGKGNGPRSDVVLAMTSEDLPSNAPAELRCSALSSKSIYVLWDPPAQDSINGILRGYKVVYKPTEEWYDAMIQSKIIDTNKLTIKNLNVNTNYSIQVLAFTKVGDGVKSSPVFCKTHEDVPEPPEAIKVLPSSSDSVVVAWKPPHRSNGALTKYNVYYKPIEDNGKVDIQTQNTQELQRDATVHSSTINSQSFEIKGLKKNKKYAFWVTATSSIGESSGSTIVAQTYSSSQSRIFDTIIKTAWQEDVVLPCTAVGVPSPNRKWTIGENLLKESNRLKFTSDGSVVITKIDSEDSGNYTCAVYNEHGRDHVTYLIAVQVPPSAPIVDIVSKTRSSIKLQWKRGVTGEATIRGYLLHYREINAIWSTKEVRAEQVLYTLDNLICGATYQLYMEAFNNIGRGTPSDTITVITEGSDVIAPTKDQIIREGSTFITVYLESWPTTGCPVKTFSVEYKPVNARDWTVAGSNVKPTQKKLVISGLNPATWYVLRLSVDSSSKPTLAEYKFATYTATGGTLAPESFDESLSPVYIFYLDPLIFIPAVTLLIVVIIASVVVCFYFKRRSGSVGTPSDISDTTTNAGMNSWVRHSHTVPRGHFIRGQHSGHSTLSRRSAEPSPYATSHLTDFYHPEHGKARSGAAYPLFQHESFQNSAAAQNNFDPSVETKFVFHNNPTDGYDPPPMVVYIQTRSHKARTLSPRGLQRGIDGENSRMAIVYIQTRSHKARTLSPRGLQRGIDGENSRMASVTFLLILRDF